MHYLLCYDLAPDYMQRRDEFRTAHLKLAWQAQERGELILAGALVDPADGAVLMFKCDSAETVERFAATDPYVINGLVTQYRVRTWNTVVGDDASSPYRPK
jgi:uncharacterized protein